MSDLLRIGAQGLSAYRGALGVVGENVANAQTEGYSRRDVALTDTAIVSGGDPLAIRPAVIGGVRIDRVTRAGDAFIDAEARLAGAETSGAAALTRWLQAGETALAGAAIPNAMASFFASADTLAGDPRSPTERRLVLGKLDEAATAFRAGADGLSAVAGAVAEEATLTAEGANADLQALARLNRSLLRAAPGTSSHAALLDDRDRRLASLGEKIGIDVSFDGRGLAAVSVAGGGPSLLTIERTGLLTVSAASDGRLTLTVTSSDATEAAQPASGALAGLFSAAALTADTRRTIDVAAEDFIELINDRSAAGFDANGNAGVPLLSGTGAAAMRALVSDPDRVPAASADGTANGNLLALGADRDASLTETNAQGAADSIAYRLSNARARETALARHREGIDAARADASGVDLDREAAELLRFQQAYDAAARVIQVARETLQSLLAAI